MPNLTKILSIFLCRKTVTSFFGLTGSLSLKSWPEHWCSSPAILAFEYIAMTTEKPLLYIFSVASTVCHVSTNRNGGTSDPVITKSEQTLDALVVDTPGAAAS